MSAQELLGPFEDINNLPDLPEAREADVSPEAVTRFTQKVRYAVFNDMTKQGTALPSDPKELLLLMRDMDNSALLTRKLDIEEKSGNDAKDAVAAAKQLTEMFGGKRDVFKGVSAPVSVQRLTPVNDKDLPAITYVPGERDQGEQILDASQFLPDE